MAVILKIAQGYYGIFTEIMGRPWPTPVLTWLRHWFDEHALQSICSISFAVFETPLIKYVLKVMFLIGNIFSM
jgi:hypothetical protein